MTSPTVQPTPHRVIPLVISPALYVEPLLIRYRFWVLLAITLLGVVMRFSYLEKPPLWGDEGFTFSRVCGDYREMLDILTYDGFPPLHYEAYWALGKATRLTPHVMRAIPAVTGTLMIPAMYFLAVQIVRKRTALLVALFTCSSAYMMVYSRDAKMYMACWLFIALNAGCFLLWRRTRLRIVWLAWIATGLAMTGFHLSSVAVLAVEILILFTGRVHWRQIVLCVIGLTIIAAGPVGYRLGFNQWGERVEEVGFSAGSGVGWVESYNNGRTGPELALYAATAHLFSWEWPSRATQAAKPGINPDVMRSLMIAAVLLLCLMAIGAMCPRRHLVVGEAKEPWNRQVLWLFLWILIPAYGVYCASMREFISPLDWIDRAGDIIEQRWIAIGVEILVLIVLSHFWKALPNYLAAAIPVAALICLNVIILQFGVTKLANGGRWRSAYGPILNEWWNDLIDPRALIALAAILPVIAWHHGGDTVVERLRRTAQLAVVLVIVGIACVGVHQYFVYRFHSLSRQVLADHHDAAQWELLAQRALADHDVPKRASLITQLRAESPAISFVMVDRHADRTIAEKESRWNQLVRSKTTTTDPAAMKSAERAAAEQIASERVIWARWVSVWMPRYLGMCWPAIAIAACALLLRLPMAIRYVAVALLIGVNLAQSSARIFAGTEPPNDRIYRDIASAQPAKNGVQTGTRTYLFQMTPFNIGAPGTLGILGAAGRYYLSDAAGMAVHPREVRSFGAFPRPGIPLEPWKFTFALDEPPRHIADDLKQHPRIKHLIIWEQINRPGVETIADRLAILLGPEWHETHENLFDGRVHWTWENLYTLRRREYVRP
jgi:4-amino-4-deoxy-L-arabinose transferase-like glycosyltransferase